MPAISSEMIRQLTPDALFDEVLTGAFGYEMNEGWKHAYIGPASFWKIHLFANSPEDWQALLALTLPYLHENRVYHKTVPNADHLHVYFLPGLQRGKVLTIYSPNANYLKQVIYDLDRYLVAAEFFPPDDGHPVSITGSHAIGESGRIFYRFDRDERGNYRPNDGHYKPEKTEDAFALWPIETAIPTLKAGHDITLGRDYFGGPLWCETVSRKHAKISRTDSGDLTITDLGSTNGTRINKQAVNDSDKPIRPGDLLSLGKPGNAQSDIYILRP